MPASAHTEGADLAKVRRKGLRIAFAVSVGFTWALATGAVIPFLGPLFAAQFLIASPRPLPFSKAAVLLVLVLVVGSGLQWLTAATSEDPMVLLPLLGLFFLICFHAQASGKGGAAVFLMLVVGIMVPLLTILHRDIGSTALAILVHGVGSGILLTWVAHALLPDTGTSEALPAAPVVHPRPLLRAAADTVILLLIVSACLTRDGWATALVIPITVASLLTQLDVSAGARASFGLVLVNLIGGIAASLAFVLLQIRPSLLSVFVLTLLAGLIFGGRAALSSASAKVHAGALTIFILIFGAGVSPLPGTAAETFSTRMGYIVVAISYAMIMGALLWPKPTPSSVLLQPSRAK